MSTNLDTLNAFKRFLKIIERVYHGVPSPNFLKISNIKYLFWDCYKTDVAFYGVSANFNIIKKGVPVSKHYYKPASRNSLFLKS